MITKYPYDEEKWWFNNPIEYCKYAWWARRENQQSLITSFKEYFYSIKFFSLKKSHKTLISIRLFGFHKIIYVWNCNERTAKKYDNLLAERLLDAIENTSESIKANSF